MLRTKNNNTMIQLREQYAISPIHLSFSILSILVVLVIFKLISRPRSRKLNLPPSPSKLPILGNLHQLGSLPHRTFRSLAQKHGPLMLLHFGQKRVLVVSSAEGAREIMKTQDLNFSTRPSVSSVEKQLYSNKDLAFSPYGEYWRQVRKMCVLRLFGASRVESFRSIREEETNVMITKIRQSCASASSVVNLSELFMSYSNDVVCRVALGMKFQGKEVGTKFWKMIIEFQYLLGVFNVGDFIPWLSWVNNFNGINALIKQNTKELDSFFESVIEEHRNKDTCCSEDLVDTLLGVEKDNSFPVPFSKDNIKAIIVDVFIAGSDTSAVTLIWVMTELMRHPETMKEVQKEIREKVKEQPYVREEDVAEMHFLKMVIKETLRLHAPITLLLPRESIEDTKVLGYDIPAKTRVLINAWGIARDPSLWDEPEEFRPERFKNRSLDLKGQDFAYIPFGGGRRGCPGITFAAATMELPLANLLYHFDWNLPDGAAPIDLTESPGAIAFKLSPLLAAATLHCF